MAVAPWTSHRRAPVGRDERTMAQCLRTAGLAALVAVGPVASAGGAQVCDTHAYPLSAASTRFEAHDDGTILDRESKLMWTRCSAGQQWSGGRCVGDARSYDFRSAMSMADDINRSGTLFFSDWRLPRAPELATIAERQCDNPRINLAIFPDTPPEFYWTTTTRPREPEGFAFALSFGEEGIRYLDQDQPVHLRLGRDAR